MSYFGSGEDEYRNLYAFMRIEGHLMIRTQPRDDGRLYRFMVIGASYIVRLRCQDSGRHLPRQIFCYRLDFKTRYLATATKLEAPT